MRARLVHHSEYLALALLLIGAAVWQKDQITAWFWHIAVDRTIGDGLRGADGGQALF